MDNKLYHQHVRAQSALEHMRTSYVWDAHGAFVAASELDKPDNVVASPLTVRIDHAMKGWLGELRL